MTVDVPTEERRAPLRTAIGRIVRHIEPPPGEYGYAKDVLAGLRRLTRREYAGKALFTVLIQDVEPLDIQIDTSEEASWAVLLAQLAHNARFHQPGIRLGRALAQAGFSELRFERLLRAPSQDQLLDQVQRAGQYLASKGVLADWGDMAEILSLDQPSEDILERRRRRMARDYYRTLHQPQNDASREG